jgi:hypothetical protein
MPNSPPRFSRKTNLKTVTGLPIYKTLLGKLVTSKNTPVNKVGNNYVSNNNYSAMRTAAWRANRYINTNTGNNKEIRKQLLNIYKQEMRLI